MAVHEVISAVCQECCHRSFSILTLICSLCHWSIMKFALLPCDPITAHSSVWWKYMRMCEFAPKSCGFFWQGASRWPAEGSQKGCGVNRDVPPQLHYLTELMKLFVMGFSAAFSVRTVISGQISSVQQDRGQLVGAPFSQCLLSTVIMRPAGTLTHNVKINSPCPCSITILLFPLNYVQ